MDFMTNSVSDFTGALKVIENHTSYSIGDKKYEWGEGLVNLANSNFEELRDLNFLEVSDNDKTYGDYLTKFLKFDTNSIHYELLRQILYNYIDIANEQIDNGNYLQMEIKDKDSLYSNVYWFFCSLIRCQNRIKQILTYLDLSNKDLKGLSTSKRLYQLTIKDKSALNFTFNFNDREFYRYENLSGIKIEFDNNGKLYQVHYFSTVQDFVSYELLKVINEPIKIIKCNFCGKYCIVNDVRTQFCSSQCKKKATNKSLQQNPYFVIYNKRYKYIYNKYVSKGINLSKAPFDKMKELFEQYKYENPSNTKKLNEFQEKLMKFT